jgi:exodeoxyribonuclease-3
MRIITLNVNGIRSAVKKGFLDWLPAQRADVICMQELKAQEHQLEPSILQPVGYQGFFHFSQKKGYGGVGVYCRRPPERIVNGLDWPEMDAEGRYLQADFEALSIISLYIPSGSSGEERQAVKFQFLSDFMPYLKSLRKTAREYIICGDWNIAHKEIDLKNWRGNQKNSGFLPQERAWMEELFGPAGFVDAFRVVNQEPEQYTWWSNRGQAWAKNVGWRIDYQVITPGLKGKVRAVDIYKAQRFSDHAPLTIDYAYEPASPDIS